MTLDQAQATVDEWITTTGVRYFSELTNMAILTEEVGEVARLIARQYGEQSFKESDKGRELRDELADVLFVLNKGVVEQSGPPLEVFARPATRFVAGFLGSPAMNFFDAHLERDGAGFRAVAKDGFALAVEPDRFGGELAAGRQITVGVRPHDVRVSEGGAPFEVSIVEALGAESYAHGTIAGAPFVARVEANTPVKKGDRLDVGFAEMHLFDKATGVSLRAP